MVIALMCFITTTMGREDDMMILRERARVFLIEQG